jgi:hypothetical protein
MASQIDDKTGERRVLTPNTAQSPCYDITASDLARLDGMTRDELIALVRRVGGARWAEIMMMDRKQQAIAMRDRLAHIALTGEIRDALTAIDKFLDREEGKATQPVAMSMKGSVDYNIKTPATQAWLERMFPTTIDQ